MFNAIIPYNTAYSLHTGFHAIVSPAFSAFPSASIFTPMAAPVSATYSNLFSYIPSISSIGNFFSNMFSKFSFSSFLPKFTFLGSSTTRASAATGAKKVVVSNEKQDMSFWEKFGYNAQKGLKLAKDAVAHAKNFMGQCATYVKNSISRCGLGAYITGDGYQMSNILKHNKNFKQISPEGVDLKKLPAGCVLVYGRGVSNYSKTGGHTEITTGTGKAVSDGITNNIRKPSAIFIPV